MLYSGVLSYFATVEQDSQITQHVTGVLEYRQPSFGTFSALVQTRFWFGLPRTVSFPGIQVDMDQIVSSVAAKDDSSAAFVAFNRQSGARNSAYEHLIPERLFTNAQQPAEGVSAVKALAVASAQGQRIYTITSRSVATALPQLHLEPEVKDDIRHAVAAGQHVTVSQNTVTVGGWSGVGYNHQRSRHRGGSI